MIRFFLPIVPPTITDQEHRIGKYKNKKGFYVYDSPQLQAARIRLTAHLAKHAPDTPMTGAVQLVVKWCFPVTGDHKNGEYKTSKPDTDNLEKMLKDCMTTVGFWKDDAQVASELVQKFWADVPGIFVSVESLDGNCP